MTFPQDGVGTGTAWYSLHAEAPYLKFRRMREHDLKERVILPELWKQYESTYGDDKSLAHVENLMPQVVKKRRKLEDGSFEECFDYLFKDGDEGNQKMLNLLRRLKSGDNHSEPNTFCLKGSKGKG